MVISDNQGRHFEIFHLFDDRIYDGVDTDKVVSCKQSELMILRTIHVNDE